MKIRELVMRIQQDNNAAHLSVWHRFPLMNEESSGISSYSTVATLLSHCTSRKHQPTPDPRDPDTAFLCSANIPAAALLFCPPPWEPHYSKQPSHSWPLHKCLPHLVPQHGFPQKLCPPVYHSIPTTLDPQGLGSRGSVLLESLGPFWTPLPHAKPPTFWSLQVLLPTAISHAININNRHRSLQRPWPLAPFISCHLPGGFNIQYSYLLKSLLHNQTMQKSTLSKIPSLPLIPT